MAYSGDGNDAGFHPTSSASSELGEYQSLSQTSATGEEYTETQTFADGWGAIGQPRFVVSSSTSLGSTASYGKYHCSPGLFVDECLMRDSPEPVASATSQYTTQISDYGQQPYPGYNWSAVRTQAQPHRSSILSRGTSFAPSETPTMALTSGSRKYLFYTETLRIRMLTDSEQSQSTTSGPARVSPLPARSVP